MKKSNVKVDIKIDRNLLNFSERLDQHPVVSSNNGVTSLSDTSVSEHTLLCRKILVISCFIHNRLPDYEKDPNPFVPAVINEFISQYPNRHDWDDAVEKLVQQSYII